MLKFYTKKIEEKLEKMHEKSSYEEMSRRLNIPSSNIAGILSGCRPMKNPSLDMFLKIFPKCKIDLHGDSTVIACDESCIPKDKVEEIKANAKKEAKETFRNRAIMAILALESLPPDAAVEVMKTLKDL